jgi:hypothetical protein
MTDPRVTSELIRQAPNRRALKTGFVVGLVESGLTNPHHGDRDSAGWRQERARYYKNPTNIRASVARFYRELAAADRGQPIAQLAQDVQRSGFPSRYAEHEGEAVRLMREALRGGGGAGARFARVPGYTSQDLPGALASGLLAGGDNPLLDAQRLLNSGAFDVTHGARNVRLGGGADGGSYQLGRGKVSVASGANRPGVSIQPAVFSFLQGLGRPITITTGTNHDQHVKDSTNVSDHWDGHAADIGGFSGTGPGHIDPKLTRLGQLALIRAGMKPSLARKQKGGAFTLTWHGHRVQIIFNSNIGGNHYNHLHVGVR